MRTGKSLAIRGDVDAGSDKLLRLPHARGFHLAHIGRSDQAGPEGRPGRGPYQRRLRIGLVSTSAVATPPKGYGGTELFVAELAHELSKRGHEVITYATGDSTCEGELVSLFPEPVWPPSHIAELRHASFAWDHIAQHELDIVHLNSVEAMLVGRNAETPRVLTLHHDRSEDFAAAYAEHPEVAYVAISARQAELSPEVPFTAVIHHGVDPSRYPAGDGSGNYCAFLGRLAEPKAPHVAIDVARSAGLPIRLGGGVHAFDQQYYESQVAPRLGEDAVRLGELGHERKIELLQGARCLVFPICWEEPFGLVMIESMLVGTPVVAFGRGAAKEIVEDGVTGFIVNTPEEMAVRVRQIGALDRERCRQAAQARFSSAVMAAKYEALYYARIEAAQRIGEGHTDRRRFDREIRTDTRAVRGSVLGPVLEKGKRERERDESHGYYEPLHAGNRIAGTILGG